MATTTGCPIPSNINPLSPNGFKLSINKLPGVSYFAQEVNLPELSLGDIEMGTPLSRAKIPGEMMTFGDLNFQFIIDENMTNYTAIYNWMTGLGFPNTHQEYTDYIEEQTKSTNPLRNIYDTSEIAKGYSDGTLEILASNNVPVKSVIFTDLFPVSLSSLTFQSTVSDIVYLIGNASFKYTTFKLL